MAVLFNLGTRGEAHTRLLPLARCQGEPMASDPSWDAVRHRLPEGQLELSPLALECAVPLRKRWHALEVIMTTVGASKACYDAQQALQPLAQWVLSSGLPGCILHVPALVDVRVAAWMREPDASEAALRFQTLLARLSSTSAGANSCAK